MASIAAAVAAATPLAAVSFAGAADTRDEHAIAHLPTRSATVSRRITRAMAAAVAGARGRRSMTVRRGVAADTAGGSKRAGWDTAVVAAAVTAAAADLAPRLPSGFMPLDRDRDGDLAPREDLDLVFDRDRDRDLAFDRDCDLDRDRECLRRDDTRLPCRRLRRSCPRRSSR